MDKEVLKITVTFERREDGGLRVWSEEIPGLVLSHDDINGVIEDVATALSVILTERFGRTVVAKPLVGLREHLEDNGVVHRQSEAGTREYAAFV